MIDDYPPKLDLHIIVTLEKLSKRYHQLVTINKKAEEATFISCWTNWVTSLPVSGIDLILLPMT